MVADACAQVDRAGAMSLLRGVTLTQEAHPLVRAGGAVPADQENPAAVDPVAALAAARSAGIAEGRALERGEWLEKWETELSRALSTGFEQGRHEGAESARMAVRAECDAAAAVASARLDERLRRLDQLVSDIEAQSELAMQQAEDDLVAIVHGAVARLVGEVALLPHSVIQAVQAARADIGREPIEVHVNPQDVDAVRDHAGAAVRWLWVGDEAVLSGAIVKTRRATLDARLESQMQAFTHALARQRSSRGTL